MEGKECTICDNPIISKRGLIHKTTSCCGVMRQMHTICAKNYYSAIYPEKKESFGQGPWKGSTCLQIFC